MSMNLNPADKQIRTDMILLAYWMERYKAGESPVFMPHDNVTVSRDFVLKQLDEFKEWDSVIPEYGEHLTEKYLAWRTAFLQHMLDRDLDITFRIHD